MLRFMSDKLYLLTTQVWLVSLVVVILFLGFSPTGHAVPFSIKYHKIENNGLVQIQDRPNLLRFLFRNRNNRVRRVSPSVRRQSPTIRRTQRVRQSRPSRPQRAAVPNIQQIEKNEDARHILVIGDFFASSVARGLMETYAQDRTIAIVHSTVSSSGFVRYDHFHWDVKLKEVLADSNLGGKADLVIVMMGGNDRQYFRAPSRIRLDTNAWSNAYLARVRAFVSQLSDSNFPLIWVGLPPASGPKTSAHMENLNEIYRNEVEQVGGYFVDIWAPFANDDGRFVAFGPDINGQRAQLRSQDGFGFTNDGRAKLTFFVKRQIDRFFSGQSTIAGTPGGMIITEDGPVLSLTGFALEDATALLGGLPLIGPPQKPEKSWEEISNAYNVIVRGVDMQPPDYRVDNFYWPSTEN